MLVYVRSKIGVSKIIYLCRGKARNSGEMEETRRKYKSERLTYIKRDGQIYNESNYYECNSFRKYM
jgi:hypothetical protein